MAPKQSRTKKLKQQPPVEEVVDHDDLCHICFQLLLRPVFTSCGHSFCEYCMGHWADVSINTAIARIGLDVDECVLLPPDDIETRCPMCRTLTVAKLDSDREHTLKVKYPSTYRSREETSVGEIDDDDGYIEPLTVYIGNEHKLVRTESEDNRNRHEWNFFVRPSRTDVIEEVQVFLHPTFRNSKILLQNAPYSIRRVGWGTFTIYVNIILKAGYSWMSPSAEDTWDGAPMGKLPVEWHLDFGGPGSQARCRLKIKKEKAGQEVEDERQGERVRRLWTQQRLRDPDYVASASPPPEPAATH